MPDENTDEPKLAEVEKQYDECSAEGCTAPALHEGARVTFRAGFADVRLCPEHYKCFREAWQGHEAHMDELKDLREQLAAATDPSLEGSIHFPIASRRGRAKPPAGEEDDMNTNQKRGEAYLLGKLPLLVAPKSNADKVALTVATCEIGALLGRIDEIEAKLAEVEKKRDELAEAWLTVCHEGNVPQYEGATDASAGAILHGVRQLASMWSGERDLRAKAEAACAEYREALESIGGEESCGCSPVCRCNTEGSLQIWKEEVRSLAQEVLADNPADAKLLAERDKLKAKLAEAEKIVKAAEALEEAATEREDLPMDSSNWTEQMIQLSSKWTARALDVVRAVRAGRGK